MALPKQVKREPKDDEDAGIPPDEELVPVPPSVILGKLQALLKTGRVLLRFEQTLLGPGWGVNGIIGGTWCSFSTDQANICKYIDPNGFWATESGDGWADSELRRLRELRAEVEMKISLPTDEQGEDVQQPCALRPRQCRSVAFAFHRSRWAARRAARLRQAMAIAAKGNGASEKTAAGPGSKAAWGYETGLNDALKLFRDAVREELLPIRGEDVYRDFLRVLSDKDDDGVVGFLLQHPDLARWYQELVDFAACNEIKSGSPVQDEAPEPPPKPVVEKRVAEAANVHADLRGVRVEDTEVITAPLERLTSKLGAQLVRMLTHKSGMRAAERLAMLKYVDSQATEEGSFRQMYILRGPHGSGKSQWALEQLRMLIGTDEDEEQMSRLVHVCAPDDFISKPKGLKVEVSKVEEEEITAEKVEMAMASNEARVRIAAQLGVQPLYVDANNLELWEMEPFVSIAKEKGYEVTIVPPREISGEWNSVASLLQRCSERTPARAYTRAQLSAMVQIYQDLTEEPDEACQKIIAAPLLDKRSVALPIVRKREAADAEGGESGPAAKAPRKAKGSPDADVSENAAGEEATDVGGEEAGAYKDGDYDEDPDEFEIEIEGEDTTQASADGAESMLASSMFAALLKV